MRQIPRHCTEVVVLVCLVISVVRSAEAGPPQTSTTRCAEPNEAQDLKPVARVLDQQVFAEDLEFQRRSSRKWRPSSEELAMQRWRASHERICKPLWEQYCREHDLEATRDEVDNYLACSGLAFNFDLEDMLAEGLEDARERLATEELDERDRRDLVEFVTFMDRAEGSLLERNAAFLRRKIESPRLTPEERTKLVEYVEQEAEIVSQLTRIAKANRVQAASEIRLWKFYRAIYEEHGGTVISSPLNYGQEPIEALRTWLEGHEKAGSFAIDDEKLRRDFWLYYKQNWTGGRFVVDVVQPFAMPRLLMAVEADARATHE